MKQLSVLGGTRRAFYPRSGGAASRRLRELMPSDDMDSLPSEADFIHGQHNIAFYPHGMYHHNNSASYPHRNGKWATCGRLGQ